jgi:hypothetical protein
VRFYYFYLNRIERNAGEREFHVYSISSKFMGGYWNFRTTSASVRSAIDDFKMIYNYNEFGTSPAFEPEDGLQ